MAIQEQISLEKNLSRVGQTLNVIIDRKEGEYLIGRTQYDSPEVDNEVLIPLDKSKSPGDILPVRITQALENDLLAEFI